MAVCGDNRSKTFCNRTISRVCQPTPQPFSSKVFPHDPSSPVFLGRRVRNGFQYLSIGRRPELNSSRFRPPNSVSDLPPDLRVIVHYEMYDGIPLLCKWMTIENGSKESIRVTGFTSEILACVEASSQVEELAEPFTPTIHVETDFTNCSMHGASAQTDVVHWIADPEYATQVNYRRATKCLLECRPPQGPNAVVEPGKSFETFRTWILAFENRDETRQALSLCRMYQTIAPWVNENPLIHHVRSADPAAVRLAIEQSAAVGFELVLMTFGSGFDIENDTPDYLKTIRELADECISGELPWAAIRYLPVDPSAHRTTL